ncbi:MAG: hypothetical protein L0387_03280 [Acidobacteria bacterium]|nr:hypothetical protein [Acidobacteriota bacterium]MCI0722800.1 hypothetical protein [Acidobacteriota bacterium]
MELDKALQFAVILAWEDLMKASQPGSVRVEYRGKPGTSLDNVSVWWAKGWGYHDLVCDYWTGSSSTHPSGACFKNGHGSDKLADTLGFIMKNQDQFRRAADAGRNGLVLIDPPAVDERREAVTWMNQVRGSDTNFASAAD